MGHPTLPTGTVTLLLTDIEGSTALWEEQREPMAVALERHDALVRGAVESHGGAVLKDRGEGDSLFAVFTTPTAAALAAADAQRSLAEQNWPTSRPLRVRIAVHTGEFLEREADYYGPAVNRAARLRGIAHGGQIVVSRAAEQLLRDALPKGYDLADLGLHRLKDLARPEQIFRLCGPGLESEFPPLRSLSHVPNNLPIQLSSFIGRELELAGILEMLRNHRLVTLVGTGGSGKTRLALQIAAEIAERFEDGVWYADLTEVSEPDGLEPALASSLSGMGLSGSTLAEAVAERHALVVFDNCEQIADMAAEVAKKLLGAAARLTVLATSRQPLEADGEALFRVPTLSFPPPDASVSFEELETYESVRLFAERAAARDSRFRLTEQNAEAVRGVCQRLDGIPLAIEQAASQSALLSPAQILQRLSDRFKLLKLPRDTADRHQTMRATIDWSYDLLSEDERTLFRRLAVFAGGWTLEAAEAICGEGIGVDRVLDLMRSLVDRSMALAHEGAGGEKRYRLLETVREYARERLGDEDLGPSHLAHFSKLAAEADRHLVGPDQADWLRRIDADMDNFRRAFECAAGSAPGSALALVNGLRRYWVASGNALEGLALLERGLDADPNGEPRVRAQVLNAKGALLWKIGDQERALATFRESLALWNELGVPEESAAVTANLGILSASIGQYAEAKVHLEKALAEFQRCEDEMGVARTLANLGRLQSDIGEDADAIPKLDEAAKRLRKVGDDFTLSYVLTNLFQALERTGRLDRAVPLIRESLTLQEDMLDGAEIAHALSILARALAEHGEPATAARLLGASRAARIVAAAGESPSDALFSEETLRQIGGQMTESALRSALASAASLDLATSVVMGLEACDRLTRDAHSP